MSNPDPNLQKLVDGAQRHVRSSGSTNARDEMMLRGLNEYEEWREQHLAGPEDAKAPPKKKFKEITPVRDETGKVVRYVVRED